MGGWGLDVQIDGEKTVREPAVEIEDSEKDPGRKWKGFSV